jgi:hypothetical protein
MVEAVVAKKIAAEMIVLKRFLERLAQKPVSFRGNLERRQKPWTRNVGPILRSCQNTAMQRDQQKHGPVAEGDRGG